MKLLKFEIQIVYYAKIIITIFFFFFLEEEEMQTYIIALHMETKQINKSYKMKSL